MSKIQQKRKASVQSDSYTLQVIPTLQKRWMDEPNKIHVELISMFRFANDKPISVERDGDLQLLTYFEMKREEKE